MPPGACRWLVRAGRVPAWRPRSLTVGDHMARRKVRPQQADQAEPVRSFFDVGIETLWRVAVALVRLLFNSRKVLCFFSKPKQYLLDLAALGIAVLWAAKWAFGSPCVLRRRAALAKTGAIGSMF